MNSLIIALNIIKRTLRDPGMLLVMILMPILGGVIAVTVFASPAVVSLGLSGSRDTQPALVKVIEDTGKYHINYMDEKEIYNRINNKKIQVGVIFPEMTDEGLKSGTLADKIKVITLKEDEKVYPLKAIIYGYANYLQTGDRQQLDNVFPKDVKNIDKPRMAIGMLTMFMLMFIGAGMTMILNDKKAKTFMRLFCAPLKEYEVVFGKLLANFSLGVIQIVVFLFIGDYLLGIDWGMPVIYIFILLVSFLLTAIGLGIGITGIVSSSQVFMVINTMLATMTCMLGGSFFSTTLMKGPLKTISNFIPQKWEMDAFEKLSSGGVFADIQINLLILLLFGAVFFTFGVKTLKPSAGDL